MASPLSGRFGSRSLPLWRAMLILVWGISLEIVIVSTRPGLWLAGVVSVLMAFIASRWQSRMPGWARALLVIWVCVSSVITLLVVDGPIVRQLMVVLSLVTMSLTLLAESQYENPKLHGRTAAVAILLVLTASYFSLLTFGTGIYIVVKPWILVLVASFMTTGLSALGWSAADVPFKMYAKGLPLAALLGAEIMLVCWWLPTAIYVGSIIASTVTILWIQTTRHVWLGDWEAGRGRRYIAIGSAVIGGILLSARWF